MLLHYYAQPYPFPFTSHEVAMNTTTEHAVSAQQKAFDEKYITSSEIQKELKIERSTLLNARRRGMLPNPVIVQGVGAFIWERKELQPYLDAWRLSLSVRRKEITREEAAQQEVKETA